MTTRLKFKCTGCQNLLTVSADLRGKRVRCPHCATESILKAASQPPASATAAASAPAAPQRTTTVSPATPQRRPKRKPAATPRAKASPRPTTQSASTVAPAAATDDWVDLDMPSPAATRPTPARAQRTSVIKHPAVSWLLRHPLIATVAILCLAIVTVSLLIGSEVVMIGIIEGGAGLVLIGFLLLPRLHLVGKGMAITGQVFNAFGTAMAGMGAVSIGSVALLFLLKLGSRLGRSHSQGTIDLTKFDPSGLVPVLGTLLVLLLLVAAGLALWHWIGIVRIGATLYLGQLTILLAVLTYGWVSLGSISGVRERARGSGNSVASHGSMPPSETSRFASGRPSAFPSGRPSAFASGRPSAFHSGRPSAASTTTAMRGTPVGPTEPFSSDRPSAMRPASESRRGGRPTGNPLGLSRDSAAKIILLHGAETNVPAIRVQLVDGANKQRWRAKREPGQLILWVEFYGPIQKLKDWVESNGIADFVSLDETERTLTLQAAQG